MNLDESYLHPNFNAYTRMEVRFAEFFSFLPVVMYRFQHKYHELLYGTDIKWYCYQSYKYDVNCSAGVYMRQTDAVVFSFTLEFDSFVFGAAYDYNFSDLKPASNGVGGFEIALLYRLKEHRQKKGNTITCPTFL
jgi:hypothetical protein